MTSQPAARQSSARWRRYLPLLGLALLAWIVSQLDATRVWAALTVVAFEAVASACGWFCLNLGIKAWRWRRLLRAQGLQLPASVTVATFLAAMFYGQVTLGRLGELFRAEALTERGVPLGTALSSSVFDRVLDLCLVIGLAAVLGAFVVGHMQAALVAVLGLGVLGSLAVAVVRGYDDAASGVPRRLVAAIEGFLGSLPAGVRLAQTLRSLVEGVRPLLRAGTLFEAGCLTCLAWLAYLTALWSLAAGMGMTASRLLLSTAAMLAALSSLLPVTVSGLGARELIYMELLGGAGVVGENAVVLALLHLAVMSACAIGLGAAGIWARARQQPPAADASRH